MAYSSTVIKQFLTLTSRGLFERLSEKYHVGAALRKTSRWDQFVSMTMGQLTGRKSLRDIVDCAASQQKKFYHLGAKIVPRSTLSRLNEKQPFQLYQDIFYALLKKCQPISPKHKFKFNNPLYSMDATSIELCLSLFPWARCRKGKGGIKLNVTLNHRGHLPEFIDMSEGRAHEINLAKLVKLPRDSIVTFDRGYVDFSWLKSLNDEEIYFVTREKKRFKYKVTKRSKVIRKTGITCDQIIEFTSKHNKQFHFPMRRIGYRDPETNKQYYFLTNHFKLSAKTIANIYKDRWQIELFFKWLKQNLKIKRFIGHSKNAVLTQIWIAMCVYLMIQYFRFVYSITQSPMKVLRLISVNCFERRGLVELFIPPPKAKEKPGWIQCEIF